VNELQAFAEYILICRSAFRLVTATGKTATELSMALFISHFVAGIQGNWDGLTVIDPTKLIPSLESPFSSISAALAPVSATVFHVARRSTAFTRRR
jgi:hypothetical protein